MLVMSRLAECGKAIVVDDLPSGDHTQLLCCFLHVSKTQAANRDYLIVFVIAQLHLDECGQNVLLNMSPELLFFQCPLHQWVDATPVLSGLIDTNISNTLYNNLNNILGYCYFQLAFDNIYITRYFHILFSKYSQYIGYL